MSCGGCVDLEPLGGLHVVRRLKEPSAERHRLVVGSLDIVDVEVEMDLLRVPVRPFGWRVVGCELKAESWLAVDIDGVPVIVICLYSSAEIPAQNALSTARSAVSNTTISRLILMA